MTSWPPLCDHCHKQLKEPGAIVLSPPLKNPTSLVFKVHLCVKCFKKLQGIMKERKP